MLKVWLSYIVALMVVLQSFIAVADIHQTDFLQESDQISHHLSSAFNQNTNLKISHKTDHEESHLESHEEFDHMFTGLLSDDINGEVEHVECHHGHCHHGSVVFIVKHHQNNLNSMNELKVNIDKINLSSVLLIPDLRPPITTFS